MRVKCNRHVQQDFALLHTANKVLDPVFELVGGLVDLFWVALSRLGQLLGRLQQLVCIGVSVLCKDEEGRVKPGRILNTSGKWQMKLQSFSLMRSSDSAQK